MKKHFRREKQTPAADMWHTLRLGLVAAMLLLPLLTIIFQT